MAYDRTIQDRSAAAAGLLMAGVLCSLGRFRLQPVPPAANGHEPDSGPGPELESAPDAAGTPAETGRPQTAVMLVGPAGQ